MVGYTRRNITRGGTTTRRLRTTTQRVLPSLYSCFELFGEKIALLLIANNKYARMHDAVLEGVSAARSGALRRGEGKILDTVKDWDNILEKNADFRIPTEDVLADKFKHDDLGGIEPDGVGLIDLADKEGNNLREVLNGKLDEIRQSGGDDSDEWRIDKFKELSLVLMATIDACLGQDLRIDSARQINHNNEKRLLFPGEEVSWGSDVGGVFNQDVIVNKQGAWGLAQDAEDEGWTARDCINILARWAYVDPMAIVPEIGDTEVRRLGQIYRVCRTNQPSIVEKKEKLLNAIDKLTKIYHRTYLNLIPYLPAHLFDKNIGVDVPKYDTKQQDPDVLGLIDVLKLDPTDARRFVDNIWEPTENRSLLKELEDMWTRKISPGVISSMSGGLAAYTEEEISLLNNQRRDAGQPIISRSEYAQYLVDRDFYKEIDGITDVVEEIYGVHSLAARKSLHSDFLKYIHPDDSMPYLNAPHHKADGGIHDIIKQAFEDAPRNFFIDETDGGVDEEPEHVGTLLGQQPIDEDDAGDDESKGEDWATDAAKEGLLPHGRLSDSLALQHSALSDILDPLGSGQGYAILVLGVGRDDRLVIVPGTKLDWRTADGLGLGYNEWLQLRLNESYFDLLETRLAEDDPHLRTARWHSAVLFAKYLPLHRDIIEYPPTREKLIELFNQPLDRHVEGSGSRRRCYTRSKKHKGNKHKSKKHKGKKHKSKKHKGKKHKGSNHKSDKA